MCAIHRSIASMAVCAAATLVPAVTRAQSTDADAGEPSALALRLGLLLGGAYTTNAFRNAANQSDSLGKGGLTLDADWSAADWAIIKLSYRGDLEAYRELKMERQAGNLGEVTFGLRPSDAVYMFLRGGGENAYYPNGSLYAFTGLFTAAGLRFELGEILTLRANYRLRRDFFPNYDLDNVNHTGQFVLEAAVGDHVELSLPLEFAAIFYSERFLLDEQGFATNDRRSGRNWRVEPTIRILPSYSLRISGNMRAEWNDSRDSYYYTGPFGVSNASVPPELINSFDSYYDASSSWEARWQPYEPVIASLRLAVGSRWYSGRPAYDAQGVAAGGKEHDFRIQPGADLEWRFSDIASLITAYSYFWQTSNDALWNFSGQRIDVLVNLWFEN